MTDVAATSEPQVLFRSAGSWSGLSGADARVVEELSAYVVNEVPELLPHVGYCLSNVRSRDEFSEAVRNQYWYEGSLPPGTDESTVQRLIGQARQPVRAHGRCGARS